MKKISGKSPFFLPIGTAFLAALFAVNTPSAHAFDPYELPLATTPTPPNNDRNGTALQYAALDTLPILPFPENIAPAAAATPAPIPAANAAPAPQFPPVDAAVQSQAERELAEAQAAELAAPPIATGFIAPAPLTAANKPLPPAPMPAPATEAAPKTDPVTTAPVKIEAAKMQPVQETNAATALSDASKTILSHVPSKIESSKPVASKKLDIQRMTPEIKALAENASAANESFDATGLSIRVQRPGLDTNYELNRAYTTLMGGESAQATAIYKNILSTEPGNEDALFGLAAIYQRIGNIAQARSYYGQLLKRNPNHREGLNNFLVLISDEAPEEALAELDRLEQRNPEFSPIPAQQGLLLKKLGYLERAREKMIRAIDLAPENLTYKYNLAVLLDTSGNYADAAALYRLLIDAALKGEKIPSSLDILQKRLNFIAAAPLPQPTIGG